MSAGLIRGNAVAIPLRSESVDLVVTSPPYFALRSYRDDGEHFAGQIGSEPTPQAFLEALWSVMHECWRVLKPSGLVFVNLGDKRSGSGGHNNSNLGAGHAYERRVCPNCGPVTSRTKCNSCGSTTKMPPRPKVASPATRRNAPDRYNQAAFGRTKSKMLLPHRFAIGCEDGLADPDGKGWIVRQDIVWSKPNGLPESVTDRPRDSHEMWFMLTKEGRYYSAVDEIREEHLGVDNAKSARGPSGMNRGIMTGLRDEPVGNFARTPSGKLPGSVWAIPSEPLRVPDWARERLDLPDHFAAFPTEWPRRLILGWSPPGVCVECGEGRRPVVASEFHALRPPQGNRRRRMALGDDDLRGDHDHYSGPVKIPGERQATITGYACACPAPTATTTPAVILDPFVGTGTVPMVARALGRYGVGIDLSADYLRLARWRTFESGHAAKAIARTNREAQGQML